MVRRQPPSSSARVASTRSLRGYDRPACRTRQAPIWRNSHGVGPRLVHGRLCPWLPVASLNPLAKDNTNRPAPPAWHPQCRWYYSRRATRTMAHQSVNNSRRCKMDGELVSATHPALGRWTTGISDPVSAGPTVLGAAASVRARAVG